MDMKEPDFSPPVTGPDRTLRRSRRILHRIHVFSLTLLIALTSSMGLLLITLRIYSEAEGVGLLALVALSIGVSFILFIVALSLSTLHDPLFDKAPKHRRLNESLIFWKIGGGGRPIASLLFALLITALFSVFWGLALAFAGPARAQITVVLLLTFLLALLLFRRAG